MGQSTIITIYNNGQSTEYCLEKYGKDIISFGRNSDCDIQINNAKVSRCHGCFYKENGRWMIQDLESRNGIIVNNSKVEKCEVGSGNIILLDRKTEPDSVKIIVSVRMTDNSYSNNYGASSMNNSSTLNNSSSAYITPASKDKSNGGAIAAIIAIVAVLAIIIIGLAIHFSKGPSITLVDSSAGDKYSGEESDIAPSTDSQGVEDDGAENESGKTTEAEPEKSGTLSAEDVYDIANKSTVEIQAVVNKQYISMGTGFYDDSNGTVITNYHVIEGAESAIIVDSEEHEYEVVSVAGYDANVDIAILTTKANNTTPLSKRYSEVRTGEKVYALGSSSGLTGTFTEGIVSTAEREDRGLTYIQHTAPITHGNSGGPLLDESGNVIGINRMMLADGQNLNFAIPIAKVSDIDRSKEMTLSEVCIAENAGLSDDYSDGLSEWEETVVAQKDDRSISLEIPTSFYVQNNGNGTDIEYKHDENNQMWIYSTIQTGDYSYLDEESFESMCDKDVNDRVKEIEEEVDIDCTLESESAYINDKYWRIYTMSYGDSSDGFRIKFLFHYDDTAWARVNVFSFYDPANRDMMYSLETQIVSSLKVY